MSEPLNIQLAIQGGGAKICTLMAVMEAVEELQNEGILKVTRIAGTSAGSIVACLFAAKIKMDDFKRDIEAGMGEKLIKRFPSPSRKTMLSQVLFGSPFWDENVLRNFLGKFFRKAVVESLNDLKNKTDIDVLVPSTNLTNLKREVHTGENNIIDSILNSCGLPYCFRTWKGQGAILVDGGICENLPTEVLEDKKDKYGPIVAISFEKPQSNSPSSIKSFSLALLDTAINNSITRAKGALDPGHVHTIKTKIGTFDFDLAFNQGLDKEYEFNKLDARNFFLNFVDSKQKEMRGLGVDFWSQLTPPVLKMMESLGQVYAIQHANSLFKYSKCSFEVRANCLLEEGQPNYGSPDYFNYTLNFQPVSEPIYCISVALETAPGTEFLGVTNWTVWDPSENKMTPPIPIPMHNPKYPLDREVLLFFNPALQPTAGSYRLRFQDEAMQIMKPLAIDGKDELAFQPLRALGKVDRIDLVIHVPLRLKDVIRLVRKNGVTQGGREMSEKELGNYITPPGFYTFGWTGENLDADVDFGVDIFYPERK